MKIPKDMDFSAIDKDPPHIVKGFEAKQLQGTWYKVCVSLLRLLPLYQLTLSLYCMLVLVMQRTTAGRLSSSCGDLRGLVFAGSRERGCVLQRRRCPRRPAAM